MTIVLLPDLALPIWEFSSYQPPSGYLSITRSASGGFARDLRRQQAQGVPPPQKVASLRPRASGLLGKAQKLRVLFVGPSLHSSVRLRRTRHSGQKSRRGRRLERYATPVYLCLSPLAARPPEGHWRAHSAAAPCRPVGFQGRSTLVAPIGAKSPSCSAADGGDIRRAACRRRGGTPGRSFPDSRNRTPPRSA